MSGAAPQRSARRRDSLRAVEAEPAQPDDGAQRVRLTFLPDGAEVRVPSGTPVFDAASWNGIAIDSTCGGYGTCKKCKVRVVSGELPVGSIDPRAFSASELQDGWRLACRAQARDDLVIEVPPLQTRPKAALAGVGRHVILRPSVQKRHVVLEEPTLEDQRPDLRRLLDAIDDLEPTTPIAVLRSLGGTLRSAGFDVTAVVVDEELIAVEAGDTTARRFAIAFDLGTTTVVATLLDLDSGQPLAVRSMLNRQQPFGADVITRVSATMMDESALTKLQAAAQATLAELTAEVCEDAEVDAAEVYEITVCGNQTMMQIALGIDPEPLSMAPFAVATNRFPDARATDFGVPVHPRAHAYVFPSLGAYVGGDIVAGMLATGLTRDQRLRLFIDVGTNSEIALGSSERVLATAAPAGPAFEAAQIRCGMRAADGAIEGVKIDGDELALQVIGDTEPVGLCGSGVVDVVAELVQAGLLDHSGRFAPVETVAEERPRLAERFAMIGQERVFVLHPRGASAEESVFISQRDVRELQFAKASIATGWQILLRDLGVEASEIQQVLLAGSFGAYLTPLSAVRIGLVPKLALPRIVSAGNVAGEGAKIAALSARERAEADAILREVQYVELSGRADFNDLFIDQLSFPG
ncbi:MAG TPA: ASKHA domain-containing protein [Solirubrobacteraceae bacterium]|nr:ASKHA domain-containing protein [Solirubrobacteraceae bacterium]